MKNEKSKKQIRKLAERISKCFENTHIWVIGCEYVSPPKDCCYEGCSKKYVPERAELVRVELYKSNDGQNLNVVPLYNSGMSDFGIIFYIRSLQELEEAGLCLWELDSNEVGFEQKEDCQRYADYLNAEHFLYGG